MIRPRFRVRVRMLLLLVALAAGALGAYRLAWRAAALRRTAIANRRLEAAYREAERSIEHDMISSMNGEYCFDLAPYYKAIADARRTADYYARLASKYDRAASHPWASVPPDPPTPR